MDDKELFAELATNSPLNRARRVFLGEVARIEQAEQQRSPLSPITRRRMEFEAVKKIAAELGVTV